MSLPDGILAGYFGALGRVPGAMMALWVTANGGTTWQPVAASGQGSRDGLHWQVPYRGTITLSFQSHTWTSNNDGRTWTAG
ncbi:MAG: hypothetical protein OWV35_00620 [Firmicutes bacterium]|nr:hypothetical protein [Bacillota bacterium]